MTEQNNGSAPNFALSLKVPPWKLLMIQMATVRATGDWQLHHDNVPAHASYLMQSLGESSNHPGDSAPQ